MWRILSLALVLVGAMNVSAETLIYVSMAPEQKIRSYLMDAKTGALTEVETITVEGAPGALAVSPKKSLLFASLRTNGSLASFRIDQATGKLIHLSTQSLGKNENAAYVATDRTGQLLLSASYMAGKVVVHGIGGDGKILAPPLQVITTVKTAHAAVTDPDNRFVFVPHVAPNAVYQFRLGDDKAPLSDAGKAKGGTAKSGPRHLAFHPSGKFAFTSDETGSSITSYRFDAKTGLSPVETLSTLPDDFTKPNTTAEVKVHPSGKFVWVSNRGHDSLAGFAFDADSGKLSARGQTPTEKTPRSFEIEPDGRFLFAAGEGTGKLAAYAIDRASGALAHVKTYDVGKSLTWVMAVKLVAEQK
jgi:6-phosphogluconolactonase